jgi:hypothetical protein
MSDVEQLKETVILVHGTWAAPVEGTQQWYERISVPTAEKSFAAKLNAALEQHGSGARCWKHCHQDEKIFSWLGANNWIERTRAAARLGRYVRSLREEGWTCHIVAHSHGGNVVAEAVPAILRSGPRGGRGKVVTLGTPFIDTASVVHRRQVARERRINIATLLALTLFVLLLALPLAFLLHDRFVVYDSRIAEAFNRGLEVYKTVTGYNISIYLPAMLCVFYVVIAYALVRRFMEERKHALQYGSRGWLTFWEQTTKRGVRPEILSINSNRDEAWQILNHLSTLRDPVKPRPGLIGFVRQSRLAYKDQEVQIAKINGRAIFEEMSVFDRTVFAGIYLWSVLGFMGYYLCGRIGIVDAVPLPIVVASAGFTFMAFVMVWILMSGGRTSVISKLAAPLAVLPRIIGSLTVVPSAILTYIVRCRLWPMTTAAALGTEGYSYGLPSVKMQLALAPSGMVQYESLPDDVVNRALARRNAWAIRHFGGASETFAKDVLSAAEIKQLLEKILGDLSLVHAAYYTDDGCVDRIARWIAGKG